MRKFVVNVNGNSYEVEVEEVGGAPAAYAAPTAPAAAEAAPAKAPAAPAAKPAATGTAGAVKIIAPMPGTILGVKVAVGDTVKKGQVIAILEAMKMENEIVAPQDAKVSSVNVTKGQQVNSGDTILTLS